MSRSKWFGLILLASSVMAVSAEELRGRLIGHSWDLVRANTADLVRNRAKLAQLPLDGISIAVRCSAPDGTPVNFLYAIVEAPWPREAMAGEIENLRLLTQAGLRHNFLATFLSASVRVRWDDDQAWDNAAHNFGLMAWTAREGGARGLIFDPEDYANSQQFICQESDGPYPEVAAQARRRGGQVMRAIAGEYPDVAILAFWLFSMNRHLVTAGDPEQGYDLEAETARSGDLWFPFINGLLDELPPEAVMIDGNEWAYWFQDQSNFGDWAYKQRNPALASVDAANRSKYLAQVKIGFGQYLDLYVFTPEEEWRYQPELDGSRLKRLELLCGTALAQADGYCWLYGEHTQWIDWDWADDSAEKSITWEDRLPGIYPLLNTLRNQYASNHLKGHDR